MVYDTIGNIAIIKFPKISLKEKKELAKELLAKHQNIKTILEKTEKVSGKLRTYKTKLLAGKNTQETVHKESACLFKLDVEKCYFSPRLSNDRLEIAKRIKKGKVLCLFSGVSPYPIIIAKRTPASKIIAIELNPSCYKYAKENKILNKIGDKLEIIKGDAKTKIPKEKFDYIVMTRPQLKETFLKQAFKASKPGCIFFYHGFAKKIEDIKQEIENQAKLSKKKIKFLESWRNGDIAPYTYRFTLVFKTLN
jgi:tRNA (guanine37-N1)-methyltransferase